MNKKAILKANVIYIMLTIGFIILMSAFIWAQSQGAAIWADYYAKEITHIINTATPGQTIKLDVHQATKIAVGNDINDFNKIFEFNNKDNEVCVKLSKFRKTCYFYYNNVDVTEYQMLLGQPINLLSFTIQKKPVQEINNEQ